MKDLESGHILGNYRVIRRIGRGGMGSVYEVESLDLHERYALKTFTYDPAEDEGDLLRNKFLEEGKILARLSHPKIAHVYSLAYDREQAILYFVMDLVLSEDGLPYSVENASFEELDEDTALAWFTDICESLDYIHSQGIVHRDIKPGNLLVRPDGHVILTDFGIAKINAGKMKQEVNPALTMRIDGNVTILGSNHYIAPEVDAGGEVTAAADAYSLGVMTYEMLTGKWYDRVKNPWALLAGRKYPWKRALAALLAPKPEDRPQNYTELAKRLPVWRQQAAERKVKLAELQRKRKRIILVASVLGAVALVGLAATAWSLLSANREPVPEPIEIAKLTKSIPPPAPAPAVVEEEPAEVELEAETPVEAAPIEDKPSPLPTKPSAPAPVAVTPSAPAPAAKASAAKPPVKASEPKKVDYGPIPARTYKWFAEGKTEKPQVVNFELANGAKLDLRPYAAMKDYLMLDAWDMGTHAHLVEFTRPYWITKFCIEPSALRDFDKKGFEDCREIETAVRGEYPVYRSVVYRRILEFCAFLTDKYRSQLPSGYVFRLPTEAEWDRAIDRVGYKRLAEPEKVSWTELTDYSSARMRGEFAALRKQLNLDRFGKWEDGSNASGFLVNRGILIGGRSRESANGLFDVAFGTQPLLDFLPAGRELVYAESERDPLQGADGLDVTNVSQTRVLCRRWSSSRVRHDAGNRFVFHLAVGPDLIAEQAWRRRIVSENLATAKTPEGSCDWNPKRIQSKLSRPKEVVLKLVNGATMTFCAVPKGKFTMSNVSGQDGKGHKVELDYAFWMTKYCVTDDQRRDFGKYDCEGVCRAVEKAFPGEPVYCAFNRHEWEAYGRFLTERYRAHLPEGYVFRLPTEAEYEWAFVSDEKAEVNTVLPRHNPGDKKVMDDFAKRLKREGKSRTANMDTRGFVGPANVCLGGLAEPNAWGIYDLWLDDWGQWTYDLYDYDRNKSAAVNIIYEEREKNPLHWDGRVAGGGIVRSGRSGRTLRGFGHESRAHLVLAPDLAAARESIERGQCPDTDFGGRFIEGVTLHSLSSEYEPSRYCTPEQKALLLSRDAAFPGERGRAFLTKREDAPWVQLELPQRMTLTGAVVETHSSRVFTAHLTVWVSDDGKRWREVGKYERELGRYRFDFKGKNATRVKFVRIGREPGVSNDALCLHKVWLYGKK